MIVSLRLSAALLALSLLLVACVEPPAPTATKTPAPTLTLPTATARPATPEPPPPTETPLPVLESPLATPGTGADTFDSPVVPTAEPEPTATPVAFDPTTVSLALEAIADGLDAPVFATHAGDGSGRIFVLEKPGVIAVLDAGGSNPQTFLDITDRVGSGGSEQGLLGLAFHPGFADNGKFYVYYTDKQGDTVISRFQVNADRTLGDPGSEAVLLSQEQPAQNHNGGMLAFGPDGMLYAGLGDGGAANDRFGNGQNLQTVLGSLIRLDVDGEAPYAVPSGNPFVDRPEARPEIWAYGLRNPWRFSFDRQSGDLIIADVGQNQWEEVNLQPAGSPGGENYGWPIMEGNHCFQSNTCQQEGLVLPVAEYDHGQGCSVTGGYVYRGTAQPSLTGAYFYGDYCTGRIWSLYADASGQWQSAELLDSGLQISSFGETEAGEMLVVGYGGTLHRLVDQR